MERRRTVIFSWLVLAFFVIVAKTQTSQSLSSMSSSSVTPRTLSSSSSSSAMSLSSVTPRTLDSSSSSSAMSSSLVPPSTLASSSLLSAMPSLPVTPSTLASFFSLSAMSSSPVTPSTLASFSSLSSMPSSPVSPSNLAFFFSLSAMSSSPVTPSTLASFSSLPSTSTPPVTPATISPASSPSTLPVTPATKPPECSDYKFLNDPSIAATYRRDGLYHVCKDNFKPGWHRFGGEAGNQMADTCVKMCHCGVVYPGWLSGGHPSVEDGAVVRRVCFGRGCTCDTFVYISVRNCSGFYVYNLTSIPSSYCYYGYCASTGFEEPTSSATERSKQRFLNGTNGSILFYTYYQECMYPHYSWQIAARKGEKVKLEVQYMDVSAWNGSCTLGYVEIQNGTYADGKPITRMCSYLLSGIETFYSHEGQSLGVHVEVANMDLYGWWWIYFEATYTVISYNDTVSNECYNYGFLNESNRAMTYVNRSNGNLCDSTLSGWYRFSGEAGTQMADSCPKIHHCSTDSPGWLNGTHPTVAEGIVQRKVCFLQHPHGIDCCYFSKDISVRNCGAFYVYRLDPPRCYSRYCGNGLPQAPECSNYKFLNDSNISATYTLYEQSYHSCKDNFKPGWYRFGGEAGNQMADTCVKMCHCGAWYPGWLTGGHPSVEDGAAVRKVCFVRGLGCCEASEYISVRNCSGFYVYNLTSIPSSSCYYGYCASTGFKEPTTSEFSKQRLLNGTIGTGSFYPYYHGCPYPHYSWQIVAKKGEKVKLEIQYMESYWWGGSCTLGYLEIQNGTYADGKPTNTRTCGYLLSGIITFYSHAGQSLEVALSNVDYYWSWTYFTATYTVISYNDTVSNECSNYRFLNESNRAMTHVNSSIGKLCDSTLSGWYRFSGEAGTQMADSCRKMYHCNTDSPGWLNGTHPTVAEGIVQRKVCFLQHLNGTDCCYFSKEISVRNCGAFYVYRLDPPRCYSRYCGNGLPQAPECSNYKSLTEANRATKHGHNRFQSLARCMNESTLSGWYRFDREAGNQMADTCVERYHCGAEYPGWLSGGHPSVEDGAVVRRVCFKGYYGHCCEYFVYISVRNCGGFYVYKLTPLPTSSYCYYRYCASNGTALVLPTTLTTEISTSSTAQTTTKPPTKLSLSSTVQTATEPLTIFVTELSTSSTAQTTGTPTTFVKEFSTSSTTATTTKPLIKLSFSSTVQTATEPLTTFLTEITTSSTVQTTTRTPPKLSTSSTAQTTTEPPTSKCTQFVILNDLFSSFSLEPSDRTICVGRTVV
ncbi:uncharacterized protein [Montipora foliosa]|uniref:uncharacterized protein isoform X5 n=1 Tax=Montipora foliosa TaxID=591990 RepID=UPI0035F20853